MQASPYIATSRNRKPKTSILTRPARTKIQVRTYKEVTEMHAKQTFKKSKAHHKAEIKKLRAEIKKHKLMIKQAKLTYKLSK